MKKILVIEDDPNILDIVTFNLQKEGYDVTAAADGEEGILLFAARRFDLVLLDIMIPKLNGLEVLDAIRTRSDIPVIIVSARTAEEDRLDGLSRMADDYICKPFSVKELMARVKVHLARYDRAIGKAKPLTWGRFTLDAAQHIVLKDGQPLDCTKKEFQIMLLFAQNPGRCYSREELMRTVWGYQQVQGDDRTVDVAVRRLREKVEDDPAHPRYIISKRGVGYLAGSGK